MKTAYFDCFSGISGDMCLGALLGAGLPLEAVQGELRKLPLKGLRLTARKVLRSGISAVKADVRWSASVRGPSTWAETKDIIVSSALSTDIKKASLSVLEGIFRAEAKVHGTPLSRVHLHEIGSPDAIADVVGVVAGIRALGIKNIYCSPVNLGSGTIKTAHGVLPVPAPATVELLKGAPVYSDGTPHELTTPTGAALIKWMAPTFCPMPSMRLESAGAGAGSRSMKDRPNVLRVFIGQDGGPEPDVTVIETCIDDMNPQIYGYVMEKLFNEGALDVYLAQIIMKKGRPGVKLTVLCEGAKVERLCSVIFSETTTLGVRFYKAGRATLQRKSRSVETEFGNVRVKDAFFEGRKARTAPEYEDCARIAKERGLPLMDVIKRVKG